MISLDLHEEVSRKHTLLVLGLITALGTFLRIYKIDFQSLWLDELYTIIPTNPEATLSSLIDYCKGDQPPLFFIYCQMVFKVFGYHELTGRLSSAFLGILSIPIIYTLTREFGDRLTGLFASLIIAVNYFHIYYSQEFRFYTLLFLLTTLSYLFFIRAFKNAKISNFFWYTICTVSLLYTHYFGMVIFATQAITFSVLLFRKADKRFIIFGIISAILVVISFTPWIPIIINDLSISDFWIKTPEPYFIMDYFYYYFGKDALVSTLLIILVIQFILNFKKKSLTIEFRSLLVILVLWFFLTYLIPYLKSIISTPVLHERYTMITLPVWIIIFAIGWSTLKKVKLKIVFIVIFSASSIINLFFVRKHYTKLQKDQYREVSEFVILKNSTNYPMYSELYWCFNFYLRHQTQKVYPLSDASMLSFDNIWLLQAHFTDEEKASEVEILKDNYNVIERYPFHNANLILLSKKKDLR